VTVAGASSASSGQLKSPLRRLGELAVPVSISNLLAMGLGIGDAIIVGRHSTDELAQLSLAWALNGTLLVAMMGLLVGAQVLVARAFGAGDHAAVGTIWRRAMGTGIAAGVALGLALALAGEAVLGLAIEDEMLVSGAASCSRILALSLPFLAISMACAKTLDALGRPMPGLWIMAGANLLNIGANLVLVPHHGADGAAWATLVTRLFTGIAMLLVLLSAANRARYHLLDRRQDRRLRAELRREGREQAAIGLSAMGSGVLEAGAFNVLSVFAGQVSALAVASFAVFLNFLSLLFMPPMGIAAATAVLASSARGAGDERGAVAMVWLGLASTLVYAAVVGLTCLIASQQVAGLFSTDAGLIAAAGVLISLVWLICLFDFSQVVLAQGLRALGATWFPAISHLGSYALVMAPLGWYLCVGLERGARGLVEAIIVASVVSCGLLAIRFLLHRRSIMTRNGTHA
jgi:multidrug resistance protein, MATE family